MLAMVNVLSPSSVLISVFLSVEYSSCYCRFPFFHSLRCGRWLSHLFLFLPLSGYFWFYLLRGVVFSHWRIFIFASSSSPGRPFVNVADSGVFSAFPTHAVSKNPQGIHVLLGRLRPGLPAIREAFFIM